MYFTKWLRALLLLLTATAPAQELRIDLDATMLINEAGVGDPSGLVDEQRLIIGPPAGAPKTPWKLNAKYWEQFPFSVTLDLRSEKNLSYLWLYDTNGKGDVIVSAGTPGDWREVGTYDCARYLKWARIPLDVTTRYLRLTRQTQGANFSEIAVYEYSDEAYQALQDRRAEEIRLETERQAALAQANAEALKRPLHKIPPYGTLSLVDEIICAQPDMDHAMVESPAGVSRIETILGRQARVLPPTDGQAAYMSYRIGKMKLLRPGTPYVLMVDYPEDAPRSMVIINTGNETSRGFHTGPTLGDAFHPKYVNNLNESIDVPLSGRWESWSLLFYLHDRFPERGLLRGAKPRPLTPEDGFDVTIAQFSAENIPLSHGAAVARVRLFEVVNPESLRQPLATLPEGLPRRHLFWREEMADGIIDRKTDQVGVTNPLDWYRYKAERMRFLGMNTFSKDLLEFGACQHWDSSPHGGNDWVFHDAQTQHLWAEIVTLMGGYGFHILPYYEYSGSKGYQGLGNQKRARPLTRDDAYTHVTWVESANADITDPETYIDFQKMLDLTVVRLRDRAPFVGAWIRSRAQLPISFSDQTLARYNRESATSPPVTRPSLQDHAQQYRAYLDWWGKKRQSFFMAMRDYLRHNGVDEAMLLYTGSPSEPGVPFATWDPFLITDQIDRWQPVLTQERHLSTGRRPITPLTIPEVIRRDLYLDALTSPGLTWGEWEVQHARPADDPQHYDDTEGVLFTHAFNRNYTVSDPRTFNLYRGPDGLALVRHYTLNENMMFDTNDQDILGYFVVDMERAGPHCMMAEALALAHGDPTMIGYLVGCNFGRGFPTYARNFNAHYLALPALPSQILPNACDDKHITVRRIDTDKQGSWLAIINTGLSGHRRVTIKVPSGRITDAVTGEALNATNDHVSLVLYPCQLRTLRIQ